MKFKKFAAVACAVTIAAAGAAGVPAVSDILRFDNSIKAGAIDSGEPTRYVSQDGKFAYGIYEDTGVCCLLSILTDDETVFIPGTIDGHKITEIGRGTQPNNVWTISNKKTIKTIIIGEGVEKIAVNAFCTYDSVLEKIYLPGTLKEIDAHAFEDCNNLHDYYFDGRGELTVNGNPFDVAYSADWTMNFHVYRGSGAEKYALDYNQWIDDNPQSIFNNKKKINIIYREDEMLYGDANRDGSVDIRDVGVIQRYICKWDNIDIDLTAADVNLDGVVNVRDVGIIQRYICKWNITLGVEQ